MGNLARNTRFLVAIAIALLVAASAAAAGLASGRASAVDDSLVEHWNGSAWSETGPQPPTSGSVLYAAKAFSPGDVWAVGAAAKGHAFTEHYNGTSWSTAALPAVARHRADLLAIDGSSSTDIWAVGLLEKPNWFRTKPLVEHFNGKAWKVVPSPATGNVDLRGVAAISPRNAWVVGEDASKSAPTLIEHWNGRAWRRVATPDRRHPGDLEAVAAASARDIWAVGNYLYHGRTLPLLLRWNGHLWKRFAGATVPAGKEVFLWGVTTAGKDDAWAVGEMDGDGQQPFAEHWNGRRWNVVSVPGLAGSTVTTLEGIAAVSGNDVWAAGYAWVNGAEVTVAEHWDGHSWQIVPTVDRPNTPNALGAIAAIPAGDVWAVGWSGSP